jgi:low affinity Fe/Cu permease
MSVSKGFSRVASAIAHAAGRPWAFLGAAGFVLAGAATGPIFHYSETWQLVINTATTINTFLMVFQIQNAQNRDSAAIQTKLDEIVLVLKRARNEMIGLEHLSDEEIEALRSDLERRARDKPSAARDRAGR